MPNEKVPRPCSLNEKDIKLVADQIVERIEGVVRSELRAHAAKLEDGLRAEEGLVEKVSRSVADQVGRFLRPGGGLKP